VDVAHLALGSLGAELRGVGARGHADGKPSDAIVDNGKFLHAANINRLLRVDLFPYNLAVKRSNFGALLPPCKSVP